MSSIFTHLQRISNSKRGIAIGCAVLLLLGVLQAMLIPLLRIARDDAPDTLEVVDLLFEALGPNPSLKTSPDLPDWFLPLPFVLSGTVEDWGAALETLAAQEPPLPGACHAWGRWLMSRARYPDAVAAFRRENQYHPHPLARYAERDAAYRSADFAHIEALIADPQHAPEMRGTFLLRVGIRQGNWPRILKHLWISEYSNIRPVWLILSLLAGLIWILLIGGMRSEGITLSFLPWLLAALTLGWFSTYPTLLSLFWMDKTFDLRPGSDFMSALLYFTASVGLREEFCKLLLFLPLLPRVLRRDRENDALVLGALVGLGFAVKENLGYLLQENDGGVAVSRFVSANLLHLSLTGINALALTRAWRDPQRWLSEALTVFAMTVGLHGLYNALLTAPVEGVGDLSVFSGTILIGCTLLFFRDLPGLARRRGFLSHSAVFLWGLCLLFNLELLLAASTLSMGASLIVLGQGGIGAALSALVFLHVVREPLHA